MLTLNSGAKVKVIHRNAPAELMQGGHIRTVASNRHTPRIVGVGGSGVRVHKCTRLTKSEALRACKSDVPAERVLL